MNSKWLLYIGILLLTLGIILKTTTNFDRWPLIILLTGIAFKIVYIISKIISKEYKPGYEIVFLITGLIIFLSGITLHKQGIVENPTIMKIIGISLKAVFVIIFIKKNKN